MKALLAALGQGLAVLLFTLVSALCLVAGLPGQVHWPGAHVRHAEATGVHVHEREDRHHFRTYDLTIQFPAIAPRHGAVYRQSGVVRLSSGQYEDYVREARPMPVIYLADNSEVFELENLPWWGLANWLYLLLGLVLAVPGVLPVYLGVRSVWRRARRRARRQGIERGVYFARRGRF